MYIFTYKYFIQQNVTFRSSSQEVVVYVFLSADMCALFTFFLNRFIASAYKII